MAYAEISMFKN